MIDLAHHIDLLAIDCEDIDVDGERRIDDELLDSSGNVGGQLGRSQACRGYIAYHRERNLAVGAHQKTGGSEVWIVIGCHGEDIGCADDVVWSDVGGERTQGGRG